MEEGTKETGDKGDGRQRRRETKETGDKGERRNGRSDSDSQGILNDCRTIH
jgi:hypothetical protein